MSRFFSLLTAGLSPREEVRVDRCRWCHEWSATVLYGCICEDCFDWACRLLRTGYTAEWVCLVRQGGEA